MRLVEIGKTAEGRDQWMAIITRPANFTKLDRYKEISRRLALAEGLTDEQAHALAREGKAVVWIDGGLHATEVLGAQQLIETRLPDGEPERRGDAAHPQRRDHPRRRTPIPTAWSWSPTGTCAKPDPKQRTHGGLPRALPEVHRPRQQPRLLPEHAARDGEHEPGACTASGIPQIIYNHHQTGPAGTVLFAPPFRDPFNYNFDPLLIIGLDLVGAAMHTRFAAEGKPGATMRTGARYSTWWNGGLRTTAYFHNLIGILTETIGNPTPMEIPFVPDRQLPTRRPALPDRAAAVALPPVDRLLDHRQPRDARLRVALPRARSSTTST